MELSEFDADLLIGGGLPNGPNSALLKWKKELVDRLRFYEEVDRVYKLHHRSTGLAFL